MDHPTRDALIYELVEATYNIVEQTEANIAGALFELGLTRPLADVIWTLDPTEQPKTMGTLASALGCEPSSATFLVERLHEKGLIERGSDPRDRRRTTVSLTEPGRIAHKKLVEAVLGGSPVLSLSVEDMGVLIKLLKRALGETKPKYDTVYGSGKRPPGSGAHSFS